MKVFSTALVFLASVEAFNNKAFGSPRVQNTVLLSSATATDTSVVDRSAVRKAIHRLDKDNFSETLAMVEPFLLNEAGISFYTKSVHRINRSAKMVGVEVPADFAKEAKATAKRRGKQEAFIQAKIEETKAAEEARAAEEAAAAAAADAVEEAAEPVAE